MSSIRRLFSAHPKIRHILFGVLITVLLVAAKVIFEQFPVGHRVELLTFELLQGQLTGIDKDPLPVVVLDISSIPGGTAGQPTPRPPLKELIQAIAAGNQQTRPKALGIDIDFSPGFQGLQDETKDIEFFDMCLSESQRVPIYLGVHRTLGSPAKTWLGLTDYVPLAAGIYADPSHTSRLPVWFKQPGNEKEVLPSFGAALAEAYRGGELPAPPSWLKPFVDSSHEAPIKLDGGDSRLVLISERLINYSKLELLQHTAIPIKDAKGVEQIRELLNNRVVILGRVRDATDRFPVPGRDASVPGVFLHASAAHTFIKEPLFELKLGFRLLADFLISLLIIWLVARVRFANGGGEVGEWHRRQRKYTYSASLLIFAAGLILVRYASVMWLDFVPLILALLLHPYVEKKLEGFVKRRSVAAPSELEITS